jgi:hypothetical protein
VSRTDPSVAELVIDPERLTLAAASARCGLWGLVGVGLEQMDEVRALWLSRIDAEDRPMLEEASRRLRAGETDHVTLEYRYRHPQRGEIWLRHSSCRVAHARNGEVRLIGAVEDITARRRHEAHLRQHSEALAQENISLREEVKRRLGPGHIVGRSAAIRRALALAEQVAATDSTALLLGETGAGKERFASYIHDWLLMPPSAHEVVWVAFVDPPYSEASGHRRDRLRTEAMGTPSGSKISDLACLSPSSPRAGANVDSPCASELCTCP